MLKKFHLEIAKQDTIKEFSVLVVRKIDLIAYWMVADIAQKIPKKEENQKKFK